MNSKVSENGEFEDKRRGYLVIRNRLESLMTPCFIKMAKVGVYFDSLLQLCVFNHF